MTDRAGRLAIAQVGRCARSVNEIAVELDCDWHTINDAVIASGTALVDDDPTRIGVNALGLDEVLFARLGWWRTLTWSTQLVDVHRRQLLDVVPGRNATGPCEWLAGHGTEWCERIEFGTLDLSGVSAGLCTWRGLIEAPAGAGLLKGHDHDKRSAD